MKILLRALGGVAASCMVLFSMGCASTISETDDVVDRTAPVLLVPR